MHVLGKVFAWMVVVGALVAVVMASKAHQVRISWHQALEKHKTDFEKKVEQVRTARAAHDDAVTDLANFKRGWGMVWDDVDVQVNAQNGYLATNDQQLPGIALSGGGGQQPKTIYAFKKTADNSDAFFIGAFTQSGPAQGNFRSWAPTWRLRQADGVNAWAGGKWRLRTLVPSNHQSRFVNLEVLLTQGDQTLQDKGLDQAIKQGLDSGADNQLRLRFSEMMGDNPDLVELKDKLPIYMIDGLVRAIAASEEERNVAAESVDGLRRDLKSSTDRSNRLLRQNSDLGRSLPGSVGATKVTSN